MSKNTFSDVLGRLPYLFLSLALIAGMLLATVLEEHPVSFFQSPPALWTALSALAVFATVWWLSRRWCLRNARTLLLLMCFLILGYECMDRQFDEATFPVAQTETAVKSLFRVRLLEKPQEKTRSTQCRVEVVSADSADWHQRRIQLSLPPDSTLLPLLPGQELLVRCRPTPIRNFSADFDYETYMKRKGYCARAFVSEGDWKLLAPVRGNFFTTGQLRVASERARLHLLDIYRQGGIDGAQLALVAALTLGKKDLMDEETRAKFATAGVAHILAVSGMHVGIICGLLSFLMRWLLAFLPVRRRRVPTQLVLVLLLWGYAFLTGLSASVIRAVLMYSVAALGICLQRRSPSWNTLGFAAFVMLLARPLYLFDLGFQLSFIAVASILWLLPIFQRYFRLDFDPNLAACFGYAKGVKNYFLQLLALSLAAQIGTAPISIYHFHQFANYFFLSNLLLVPLSAVITYAALGFLLSHAISSIFPSILPTVFKYAIPEASKTAGIDSQVLAFLGKALDCLLKLFCRTADWIDTMPGALSQGLWPTKAEVMIAYTLLLLAISISQNKVYLYTLNRWAHGV